MPGNTRITRWAQFERKVRRRQNDLLRALPRFPDAILVAGCQRSGTTAVTRIIRSAIGMPDLHVTSDDELDAALILSGRLESTYAGRHCFQTTYLNDSVDEYFRHDSYRLVWLLRRPTAVVQSMLRNWKFGALVRLFQRCGSTQLEDRELARFRYLGALGFSRLRMACLSYNARTAQIHDLAARLPRHQLLVIDYDDLVEDRDRVLPALLEFCGVPYDERYAKVLRRSGKSQRKLLPRKDYEIIDRTCLGEYQRARRRLSPIGNRVRGTA